MNKVFALSALAICVLAGKGKSNLFDDDSEFIKGFEVGLMMRSKGGDPEEMGCVLPMVDLRKKYDKVLTTIEGGMTTVEAILPNEAFLAFQMIQVFTENLVDFIILVSPESA